MSQNNPQFEQMIAEAEAMDSLPIGERNALFINEFDQADNGSIKGASAAGSNMIRRRIRENGFTRRILPPQTVGNEDLDRLLTSPKPAIIEDMEPTSRGAVSLPFGTAAEATSYFEDRFQCVFSTVSTPEFYKDINELRTTRMDLRQVVTENSLKDVETQEDVTFINGCDEIVGTVGGVGASGVQQNFEIEGGITRETQNLGCFPDAGVSSSDSFGSARTAAPPRPFRQQDRGFLRAWRCGGLRRGQSGQDALKLLAGGNAGLGAGRRRVSGQYPPNGPGHGTIGAVTPHFKWLRKSWGDGGYSGPEFAAAFHGLLLKLDVEVVKHSDDTSGYDVLHMRWVVERTLG